METTKELTKKSHNMPALPEEYAGSWGTEESTAEDIIIPKLLLMHGQSEKVLEGEKTQGELVRSTDWETVAKKGDSVRVVPFLMQKVWRISEIVDGQAEWRGAEPWTPDNTDLDWEYTQEGKDFRRDQAYNFYALLPGFSKKDELNFPIKLQFTRTSRKAGKTIADHFAKSKMMNRPPAVLSFEIGSEFIKGDKNSYFVFTSKAAKATTMEEIAECKQWYDIFKTNASRIKDHAVEEKIAEETLSEDTPF